MKRRDLVVLLDVKWEKGGTEQAENYTFFYGEGNEVQQLGASFLVDK
jgi:hypothetical protein